MTTAPESTKQVKFVFYGSLTGPCNHVQWHAKTMTWWHDLFLRAPPLPLSPFPTGKPFVVVLNFKSI